MSDTASEGDTLLGAPVLDSVANAEAETLSLVFAIGDNHTRQKVFESYKAQFPSAQFPVIIHHSAYVSPHAHLEEGTIVLAQAHVNAMSNIGAFSIINSLTSIDHDNQIGAFSSLAPASATGGNVTIEHKCAIGMGAVIKHGVRIGEQCVIGANSYVHQDCESHHVYFGTPARKIRARKEDEPYL